MVFKAPIPYFLGKDIWWAWIYGGEESLCKWMLSDNEGTKQALLLSGFVLPIDWARK